MKEIVEFFGGHTNTRHKIFRRPISVVVPIMQANPIDRACNMYANFCQEIRDSHRGRNKPTRYQNLLSAAYCTHIPCGTYLWHCFHSTLQECVHALQACPPSRVRVPTRLNSPQADQPQEIFVPPPCACQATHGGLVTPTSIFHPHAYCILTPLAV